MTIAIRKFIIPRPNRFITQGQTVNIIVQVENADIASELYPTSVIPLLTVNDPLGIALVTEVEMVALQTGIYGYALQTTTANPLGIYIGTVTIIDGDEVARIENISLFKIITVSTLVTFTYLLIQDQSGALWYWYVAADNTLAFSPVVPSITNRQSLAIALSVIPHWLVINNPTPAVRYVYPSLTGEAAVTATQPSVGTGTIGSPVFTGVINTDFMINLNISDEIILDTVP